MKPSAAIPADIALAETLLPVAIRAGAALPPGRDPDATARFLATRSMLDVSYAGSPLIAEWPARAALETHLAGYLRGDFSRS